MRWAVVLAGGVGSRFWPLSSAARPKQFLPLAGPQPLIADALARVLPLIPAERVLVVTSQSLADATRAALPMIPGANLLAEPRRASTATALAWATAHAARADRSAVVLSVHADWVVSDGDAFRAAAAAALDLAEREDVLVTVGARPTRPETGYGWIVPGEPLGSGFRIARFQEKPSADAAAGLMASGALWNTGLFAWTAKRFRAEVEEHTPELARGLPHFDAGDVDAAFKVVTPVTVDIGLLERTRRGAVLPASFGWDDVGGWPALRRVRSADAAGNVTAGEVWAIDSERCVLWSEEGPVVAFGLTDAVVVRARGVTFVTTVARAPDLKKLLDQLPPGLTGERGA